MTSLIFRHLTGGKAHQEAVFTAADLDTPLTIGRDPSNPLSFTEDDEAASRHHARVVRTEAGFSLVDLGSANGLYRNSVHVTRSAELQHGDVLRFGQGGPELSVRFDPPPAQASRPTRVMDGTPTPSRTSRPTRVADALPASDAAREPATATNAAAAALPSDAAVGRATVERMIGLEKGRRARAMNALAAGMAVILAVGAWQFYRVTDEQHRLNHLDTLVKDKYAGATVRLVTSWRLAERSTGKPVYHQWAQIGGSWRPAYVRLDNGVIEPWLTVNPTGQARPIAGGGQGSGFVVGDDGTVVTNRHVVAGWYANYTLPFPGVVFAPDARGDKLVATGDLPEPTPYLARWIPARSQLNAGTKGVHDTGEFYGDVVSLSAFFPNSRVAVPVQRGPISPVADVATVKLAAGAGMLRKVEMHDAYDTLRPGQPLVVLGYPGISARNRARPGTTDPLIGGGDVIETTDVAVTGGKVTKLVRSVTDENGEKILAQGDYYEASIGATGAGNSGGPVFDSDMKVIGIYSLSIWDGSTRLSGVVPIRYAQELLSPTRPLASADGVAR